MRIIKKVFNISVSVKEGAAKNVLRGIVQFDTLNEVNIRLSDGTKAFNYDGYTNIIFKVLKADGTAYIDSEGENVIATSPVDGVVTVNLAGQSTTAAGLCQSVLEIYSGDGKMTTARFNYEVFENLDLDEAVESTTEYPALQNLMMDLSELEAAIEAAEAKRATAETQRVALETGYVARAESAAKTAEMWAKASQNVAEGDFATRAELEAVEAGAAPDGYGLGGNCKTITDWNTALKSGWYKTTTADANNNSPDGFAWYGYVTAYSSELVVQEVWHANNKNWANKCVRWLYNGVWSAWEYVNPPMQTGVEYRTTERYLSKPVYAKLINFGALPNATTKTVKYADDGVVEYPVHVQARVGGILIPAWTAVGDMNATFVCYVQGNGIYIQTDSDRSASTAVVLIKYTKTTDT